MKHSLERLSNDTLRRDLKRVSARSNGITAELLEHLAEFDARKLHVEDGYPSMYAYCVGELKMCEQAAYKRIHAARAARRHPEIFAAVAEGRLHLSAVVMLAAHLTPENATRLMSEATHRSKAQIEQLLAHQFPRPDLPDQIVAVSALPGVPELSPGKVAGDSGVTTPTTLPQAELSPGTVPPPAPAPAPARVAPLAPQRFAMQLTIGQGAYDKLQRARELLGLPNGDLASVIERALDALIVRLEKRTFAATDRPGRPKVTARGSRHIPAPVKRLVWGRDGGQCTFVSDSGRRCSARSRLEFDHVEPHSRGGEPTVGGIRLRCRAHNQYEAERAFGKDFMRHQREAAREWRDASSP